MTQPDRSLTPLVDNSSDLAGEMRWLRMLIEARIQLYLGHETPAVASLDEIPPPDLAASNSPYASFLRQHHVLREERAVLLLALAPHICPWTLDPFFMKNEANQRGFTEFGGVRGNYHNGFLPTGETAAFLLAAENLTRRFQMQQIFQPEHFFMRLGIVRLEKEKNDEPFFSGALVVGKDYLSHFTTGEPYVPVFNSEFPAQRIHTNLDWDDLVLDDEVLEDLQEIVDWIRYQYTIMDEFGLRRQIKPGFRALFYGPSGTGKTLAASLLGKACHMDTFRIDISKVVSKYIGETEKNLANIFDQAEHKNWILFFDEADAIFGKRTATKDAKDRYANQETAYLLQRIEDFPGLIILASNLKSNLDEAFARRFQSMISFPIPRPELRHRLWQKAFANLPLAPSTDLWKIAQDYELTGGAIINVLRFCAIKAVSAPGRATVQIQDILTGIRKEFRKEGKTV